VTFVAPLLLAVALAGSTGSAAATDPAAQATKLYREGRLPQAEAILRDALETGPDRADLRFLLGVVLRDGTPARLDEAVSSCRAALRLDPALEDAAGALAEVLLGDGKTEEAEAFLRDRVEAHPTEATSLRLLGADLSQTGHPEEGMPLLERAIRIAPDDPPAWLELGRTRLRTGDVDGAIEALEEARRLAPDSPSIHYGLAQAYITAGREADGAAEMEAYTKAQQGFSEHNQDWIESRRRGKALADYQSEIEAKLDLPLRWYLGFIALHDADGTLPEAREFFERLAAEHPDRAGPRVGLAILTAREDRAGAWEMLLEAHHLEPSSAMPLEAMSRIADTPPRRAELGKVLAEADASADPPPHTAFLRGLLSLADGRLEDAREQFERARKQEPEDPAVLVNLGVTYARLGRTEDAVPVFSKLLSLDPGNQEARFNRALALASGDKLEGAAADLEQLLANGFEEPRALNLLARIREAQGRREEAVALLERSLAADPDQPTFRAMLQRLQAPPEPP